MSTCKKYCVYLKELSTTTPLTPEEQDLMRTMPEIDAWYETEMNNAKLEGEERRNQAIALEMLRENIPLETIVKITGLTTQQLAKLSSLTE
jgi:predicted Rossmann fold nucleotide-binding protein DprA/Smf involved in DNA uptake